ncbi:NifB/NifX family molybdenum-iron cluster-binding protein [Roseimarinus sediminis]|uniref:NifB/NifX family molybdenum-iron cluster-binding protein n=1 Tax=Roseimarinus sediminis TaxID=1610899 RepID=UPI003D1F2894
MKQKIAIPVSNGVLDAHFGHCQHFMIFTTENKTIVETTMLDAPPHEPGLLPRWLSEKGVTDIIAGGMGNKAISLFQQNGVNVFVGAPQLEARRLVESFFNQTISFTANYCDH